MTAFPEAQVLLRQQGWPALPLPNGAKWPPPSGSTGKGVAYPTDEDYARWTVEFPDGNVAIRMPVDVVVDGENYWCIGLDFDCYGAKTGAATLVEAEKRFGPLPYTCRITSRDDGVSGIRLYLVPAGTVLHGVIKFPEMGIGDVDIIQPHHRYAVTSPSIHPEGRQYRCEDEATGTVMDAPGRPDELPLLPALWVEGLRIDNQRNNSKPAGEKKTPKDPQSFPNVTAAMTAGQPSKKVSQRLGQAIAELAQGLSRHDSMLGHVLGLLRYGRNGQPGVELALIALYRAFYETVGPDRPGGEPEAMEEFVRMCANAETLLAAEPARGRFVWPGPRPKFGSATREDDDGQEAVAGTVSSAPPSCDIEEFWESSAQLRYIRDYARSKLVGPWSTLGGVLVRRVGQVHPKVVLPAVVSGRSSLNLDIGLVGKPSAGKGFGPGRRAYRELMCSPEELGVGSGEGVTHQFIRRARDPDDPKRSIYQRVRWSVLFTAEEIDTLAALSTRSASTISSQLRKGWSAEPLGFAYVDQDKALPLPEHSYRLCVLTGVQPNRAKPLLDESTGGLPQRFLYLPVNDPDAPDQTPRVPTPEPLPELPDGWKLPGTSDFDEGDLAAPFTPARFVDIGIDAGIVAAVEADRRAGLRDTSYEVRDDDLAAHRNLMRLRSAAALMLLEGRKDITVADWDRAGLLLAVSESTVTRVREAIKSKSSTDNLAAGRAAAARQKVIAESEETDRVRKATDRIVTVLGKNTGGMWWGDLRRAVGVRHRDYAEEGLDYLIGAGVVKVEDRTTTTANGAVRKGKWVVSR